MLHDQGCHGRGGLNLPARIQIQQDRGAAGQLMPKRQVHRRRSLCDLSAGSDSESDARSGCYQWIVGQGRDAFGQCTDRSGLGNAQGDDELEFHDAR